MPLERIANLGQIGLNADVAPTLLPPNAATDLYNVVPIDGSLHSAPGEQKLFDISIKPLYHTAWRDNTSDEAVSRQWIVVSDGNSVIAYDMQGNAQNITPTSDGTAAGTVQPLSGGFVTFTDLNGILVVNSSSNGPFYWPGPADPVNPIKALPGWNSSWRCSSMIAYRYGLFALGMTEGLNHYPYKVRWSNSAQEGALPTSWDPTDLSKDAGDDLLGETQGKIVGGARIRGQLYIIKEDAIYRVRYVGGQYIYAIERLQGTIGTSALQGWSEVQGALVIFTSSDVLVFDGQRQVSLSDGTVRRRLFNSIKEEYWDRSQLYYHAPSERLYVAAVTSGDRLSEAFIYDPNAKTWGHQTLKQALGFDTAYVTSQVNPDNSWDAAASMVPWDTPDGAWNKGIYEPSTPDILIYESNGLSAEDPEVKYWVSFIQNVRNLDSLGAPKNCTARREGLLINGANGLAMLTDVWFELSGSGQTSFRVGAQAVKNGIITWSPYYKGDPLNASHIDVRLTGRFLCWEIQTQDDTHWELSALTFNWESAGER